MGMSICGQPIKGVSE